MIRKLLSICALATLCCTVSAQEWQVGGQLTGNINNGTVKRVIQKSEAEVAFTYFESEYFGIIGMGSYAEVGEVYNIAMYIPSYYAGTTVTKVGFYLYDPSVLTNIRVWVSASLPDAPEDADEIVDVETAYDYSTSETTQTLSGDYVVPDGGCYVGYCFELASNTATTAQYPVLYDYYNTAENSLYLWTSVNQPEWYDYGDYYGASTITATLYGEFFDDAAMFNSTTFNAVAAEGVNGTATIEVMNAGSNNLYMLAYTVTDVETGDVSDEEIVLLNSISTGATSTFDVEFEPSATLGSVSEKMLTITRVNETANQATSDTTLTGVVKTISRVPERNVVEEEFSTTDCGWCPRGIVGLNAVEELYPDNFIGIAVHSTSVGSWYDPMFCYDYYDILYNVSSFPGCYLDRNGVTYDPFYGSDENYETSLYITNDIDDELAQTVEAEVAVSAEWNADSTVISVTSDATFLYTGAADYGIAYVLVGDSLTGSSSNWYQYNYFYYYSSYYEDDPYLSEWCSKSYRVTDMVYNHVAIAAQDIVYGTDGSIPTSVVNEEAVEHTTTFDISDGIQSYFTGDELIQDKTQLHVVALLIDRNSGTIINAAKTDIAAEGETGITNVQTSDSDNEIVARYTIDGKAISEPVKGINIVKYANGKTVKQIVR